MTLHERIRLAICKTLGLNPAIHSYAYLADAALSAIPLAEITETLDALALYFQREADIERESGNVGLAVKHRCMAEELAELRGRV